MGVEEKEQLLAASHQFLVARSLVQKLARDHVQQQPVVLVGDLRPFQRFPGFLMEAMQFANGIALQMRNGVHTHLLEADREMLRRR